MKTRRLVPFDLRSIAVMDEGRLAIAFNHALDRCRSDLESRPGVGTARSVTLKVNMAPVADEAGNLTSVDVTFDIVDKIPKRQTQRYNMAAGRGGLIYNDLSPEAYEQLSLPFGEEPPEVIAGGKHYDQDDHEEDSADVG